MKLQPGFTLDGREQEDEGQTLPKQSEVRGEWWNIQRENNKKGKKKLGVKKEEKKGKE